MNSLRLSEAEWSALNAKRKGTEKPQERTPAPVAQSDKAPLMLRDQIVAAGLPEPVREHTFHPTRNWRIDLAFVAERRGIEIEGQVHAIRDKRARDQEKHNAMVKLGWAYLRFTPDQVRNGEALQAVKEWFA